MTAAPYLPAVKLASPLANSLSALREHATRDKTIQKKQAHFVVRRRLTLFGPVYERKMNNIPDGRSKQYNPALRHRPSFCGFLRPSTRQRFNRIARKKRLARVVNRVRITGQSKIGLLPSFLVFRLTQAANEWPCAKCLYLMQGQ